MSFLLDTCAILWAAREPHRLPSKIRDILLDSTQEITISVVSAWEISVKPELGIADPSSWFRTAGQKLHSSILAIRLDDIAVLQCLPYLHKDPFDRLLIAQAIAEKAALITSDEAIRSYPTVRCVWE